MIASVVPTHQVSLGRRMWSGWVGRGGTHDRGCGPDAPGQPWVAWEEIDFASIEEVQVHDRTGQESDEGAQVRAKDFPS